MFGLKRQGDQARIWVMKIGSMEEGPYTVQELKEEPRLTAKTLLRKEGALFWRPLALIPELKEVLEHIEERRKKNLKIGEQGEALLELEGELDPLDPPPFFFFLFLLACVLLYAALYIVLKTLYK